MTRRTLAIVVAITLLVGLSSVILLKDHLWPQQAACTPPLATTPFPPQPTTPPRAVAADQLWGKAALGTQVPMSLTNGHYFAYLASLADGTMLVGENATCGPSWVSAYSVATGTVRQICKAPDGTGQITDGRYMAWITGDSTGGAPTPRQRVGYMDLATCKVKILYDLDAPVINTTFVVGNGNFIWEKGTIHVTNMVSGVTKNLAVVGTPRQVVWPYLLYQEFGNDGYNTCLYNLATDQQIALPSIIATVSNPTIVLTAGPTVYWVDEQGNIQQIDHADRSDAHTHVAYTISHGSFRNVQITDRLFIWADGSHLYAWDRMLNQETVLPAAVDTSGLPNSVYSPQIFGNTVVLTSYGADQQLEYRIIDTATLPTIAPSVGG